MNNLLLENLRIVSHIQNCWNIKDVKGYCKVKNKFKVIITINNKQILIGYFDTEEEARQAYLDAKKIYHVIP